VLSDICHVPRSDRLRSGGLFMTLGIISFFDRSLLAMGNILFLIGIPLILGPYKTLAFFARREKLKGTGAFVAGILLILLRWAFIGFLVEGYGIFVLFGDFLWTIAGYVQNVPVVGPWVGKLLRLTSGGPRGSELPV
jgi:hypothetical protein